MNTLIEEVIKWGGEKGILDYDADPIKQLDKTQEELNETRDSAVLLKNVVQRINSGVVTGEDLGKEARDLRKEVKDGIGDTIVTLILFAKKHDLEIEECLQFAYDEIKGRTGKMVDGTFVKD